LLKVILYPGPFSFLLILLPSESREVKCEDGDNTVLEDDHPSYYTKSTLTDAYETVFDVCLKYRFDDPEELPVPKSGGNGEKGFLAEWLCDYDEDGVLTAYYSEITCRSGCVDGACKKDWCSDSDNTAEKGRKIVSHKIIGTVKSDEFPDGIQDTCATSNKRPFGIGSSGKYLIENWCDGNDRAFYPVRCPDGYSCSGGKCLPLV